jgi:hypothetical protein
MYSAETLLDIAEFLPTSSVASLALCNRILLIKLGGQSFRQINASSTPVKEWFYSLARVKQTPEVLERDKFLEGLDRDSLDLSYCFYCKELHVPEITNSWMMHGRYVRAKRRRPCAHVQAFQKLLSFTHDRFNFAQVKKAMKYYRAGQDVTPLLKAIDRTTTTYHQKHTSQRSSRCRIAPNADGAGTFLVRTRHWFLFRAAPVPVLPSYVNVDLCTHVSGYGSYSHPTKTDELVRCKMQHHATHNGSCRACAGIRRCVSCGMEYALDSKRVSERTWALCFTVWKDFGEARHPSDAQWERMALGWFGPSGPPLPNAESSIRQRFGDYKSDPEMSRESSKVFKIKGLARAVDTDLDVQGCLLFSLFF